MKTEITLELRNKIRRDMRIVEGQHYPNPGGEHCGILYFDKDKEFELFEECIIWKEMLDTYFKTSYNGGKAKKVGRFIGIKPEKIHLYSVEFIVSTYKDPSWRDWFDVKGEDDAPKLIA